MRVNIKSLIALSVIIGCINSACTFTEVKSTVNNSLVFAGNVSVSETSTDNLYFLFYGVHGVIDREQLSTHTTLIVFGNPGSSSQYLNLGGLGPLTLTNNLTLVPNPNSPYAYANILFIDTLGVGFSFAHDIKDIPTTYLHMSEQVRYALTQFKNNIDFGKGKWIFVGEGSWIRSIGGYQNIDDSLIGVVSLSPWGNLYDYGKYGGIAGVELGILGTAEKNTIETTFTTCYLYIRNAKYNQAHQCYDQTLNYVLSKTNNRNLFNINLNSTLIDRFSMIEYYLSISSNAQKFLTDTTKVFQHQSNFFQSNVYAEQAQNFSQNVTNFMRDYLQIKYLFIAGTLDYLSYYKATRAWIQGLNFLQASDFKSKSFENITIDENIIGQGKQVKHVKYIELQNSGNYIILDQPSIFNSILKQWVLSFHNTPKNINLSQQ